MGKNNITLSTDMYEEKIIESFDGEKSVNEFVANQQQIQDKINNGLEMTDEDIQDYVLTKSDKDLFDRFKRTTEGLKGGISLKDYIASPQAKVLIPKIIIGAARRAADPVYLASNFYKKVRVPSGSLIISPVIGTMAAQELAEGQAPAIQALDIELMQENQFVTATKKGIMIQVTEQYLRDSQWDLIKYLIEEAGFAMARLKEQLCMIEMQKRGFSVFDNSLAIADAKTSGVDYLGAPNNTMSIDDFLDLIIALMNNEHMPTDVLMHPLVWPVFARNGLTGALTGMMDSGSDIKMPNSSFQLGPQAVQGRIPFGLKVSLSPFVPIDTINRTFDMIVLDRNNLGIQIVQDDLRTDEFRDPLTDIQNIKMVERYNFATFDEGRGIAFARNISMNKSYPFADRFVQLPLDPNSPLRPHL